MGKEGEGPTKFGNNWRRCTHTFLGLPFVRFNFWTGNQCSFIITWLYLTKLRNFFAHISGIINACWKKNNAISNKLTKSSTTTIAPRSSCTESSVSALIMMQRLLGKIELHIAEDVQGDYDIRWQNLAYFVHELAPAIFLLIISTYAN